MNRTIVFIIPSFLVMSFCMDVSPSKEKYERDLQLNITFEEVTDRDMIAGYINFTITNHSATEKYKIVLPSDGSESAWREPYVYFSADVKQEDETWQKLKPSIMMRCGNFDEDFTKDTITINPGQKFLFSNYKEWFVPEDRFQLDKKSRADIRVVAHYDYGAGKYQAGYLHHDSIPGIPAFELTSDTIYMKGKK